MQWLVLQGDQLSQSAWNWEGPGHWKCRFELGKSGLGYLTTWLDLVLHPSMCETQFCTCKMSVIPHLSLGI